MRIDVARIDRLFALTVGIFPGENRVSNGGERRRFAIRVGRSCVRACVRVHVAEIARNHDYTLHA